MVNWNDPITANLYIKDYFELPKLDYNSKEFKINNENTNLLAIHKPNIKKEASEVKLETETKTVKQQEQILMG